MACRAVEKGYKALEEIKSAGIQGSASVIQLDVADDASIAAAVKAVEQQFGRVDVFVSNAGIAATGSTGRERLNRIFETNVIGAMLVSEAFVPLLLKSQRPYLIQVSSGLGSLALASDPDSPYYASPWDEYRMSKAALNMLTIQQHKRLQGQNVRVFAFCPGLVRSRLRGESEEEMSAWGNAGDPMIPAKGILDMIEGKRETEVGKFINTSGTNLW